MKALCIADYLFTIWGSPARSKAWRFRRPTRWHSRRYTRTHTPKNRQQHRGPAPHATKRARSAPNTSSAKCECKPRGSLGQPQRCTVYLSRLCCWVGKSACITHTHSHTHTRVVYRQKKVRTNGEATLPLQAVCSSTCRQTCRLPTSNKKKVKRFSGFIVLLKAQWAINCARPSLVVQPCRKQSCHSRARCRACAHARHGERGVGVCAAGAACYTVGGTAVCHSR